MISIKSPINRLIQWWTRRGSNPLSIISQTNIRILSKHHHNPSNTSLIHCIFSHISLELYQTNTIFTQILGGNEVEL